MRDEELAEASARHAARSLAAGGAPRDVAVPEQQPLDERVGRARASESVRMRRAGDEILTRRTGRVARNQDEVDRQARRAWSQVGDVEVDFDARVTLAAAIHASRAATAARQRGDEASAGAARAAERRLASRVTRADRTPRGLGSLGDVLDEH